MKQNNLFKKMIASAVLLLAGISIAIAAAESSETTFLQYKYSVSLKADRISVSDATKQVTKQIGVAFSYSEATGNVVLTKVNVAMNNAELNDILNAIFKDSEINWVVKDNMIGLSIAEKTNPATNVQRNDGSLKRVSGKIVDANGDPIVAAMVYSPSNKNYSATTDINGNFSLNAPAGEQLVISMMGYKEQYIEAGKNSTNLSIELEEETYMLEETIFVGYGVQKRSDITGSISSVKSETLRKIPTTNVAEMMRGSVAGVQVNIGSAAPGGTSTVLIRGRRSLSADNTPLYIVDGAYWRSINELDASSIASMEVLKDAAAQAIYGARAANGVILITTKQGAENKKAKVSYDGYVAVQSLNRNFDFWDYDSWIELRETAYTNYYLTYDEEQCYSSEDLRKAKEDRAFINWEEVLMKEAVQHKHNLSVDGGGRNNQYSVNLGYYDQDGMLPNSWHKRYTGRFTFKQKINNWLSLGVNMSLSRTNTRTIEGTWNKILNTSPLGYLYEDDGVSFRRDITGFATDINGTNPLWDINESCFLNTIDRANTAIYADIQILEGLTYRLNTNYDTRFLENGSYYSTKHGVYANVNGQARIERNRYQDYLLENILNYNKDFTAKHHFDATLMQSLSGTRYNSVAFTGKGMVNDDYGFDAISNSIEFTKPSYGISERALVSFMGRVRYSYDSRYLFSAAVRVDGSSVFGKDNKYGIFPSGAFAWRINKEPWMNSSEKWLSNLKLRLSYGEVGNQAVDPYTTLGTTSTYYNEFTNSVIGFLPTTTLYNPNLKWETSATSNIGLDFGFFKDRINGSIEIYNTDTRDLLVTRQIPSSTGYDSQLANLGKVNNRGLELTLNTIPISTRDFQWDLDFTWSMNRNKIVEIDGRVDENGEPINDLNNNWFIGKPMSVYYDYQMIGIWQNEDVGEIPDSNMPDALPGDIRLADLDEDGKISEGDKILYERDPKWIGGLSTAFYWKGIDLSAAFDFQYGGYTKNGLLYDLSYGGTFNGKGNGMKREYWTEENHCNTAPRPVMQTTMPAYISTIGYQDASFIRLRNLTLGYTFPKALISKVKLSSLRFYVSGTNVWYKTDVYGYGPGTLASQYPQSRMWLFGVNVSF